METAGARCVGLFADKSFDRLMETTMTDQTTRLPVRRALISVSDKIGILEFARKLVNRLFFVLKHQTEYVNSIVS